MLPLCHQTRERLLRFGLEGFCWAMCDEVAMSCDVRLCTSFCSPSPRLIAATQITRSGYVRFPACVLALRFSEHYTRDAAALLFSFCYAHMIDCKHARTYRPARWILQTV